MKAFPSRTAAFIRALGSDVCPMNKVETIIRDIHGDYWSKDRADYSGIEVGLAEMVGPTKEELDAMLEERMADRVSEVREETRRTAEWNASLRLQSNDADRKDNENRHLRHVLEQLGIDAQAELRKMGALAGEDSDL